MIKKSFFAKCALIYKCELRRRPSKKWQHQGCILVMEWARRSSFSHSRALKRAWWWTGAAQKHSRRFPSIGSCLTITSILCRCSVATQTLLAVTLPQTSLSSTCLSKSRLARSSKTASPALAVALVFHRLTAAKLKKIKSASFCMF